METYNPIDLLFGGMEKLGPGGNSHTIEVLRLLPKQRFKMIVDAGCGAGRQTLVLANELRQLVHAVDSYEPFLEELVTNAKKQRIEQFVETHCMDMKDIPAAFQNVDLLWSEGSAYNIGFVNALTTWAAALKPNGFVVVSELSWITDHVPDKVWEYFETGYPDMQTLDKNVTVAKNAGYEVLSTYVLPKEAWIEGYYEILEPRAKSLVDHPDASVRDFAAETLSEIEIFNCSEDSYGYVFFLLQVV